MRTQSNRWSIVLAAALVAWCHGAARATCQGGMPDGVVQLGEECDDGNLVGGDCCANDCSDPCDDAHECTLDSCSLRGSQSHACHHANAMTGTPCESDDNPCTHDACNSQGSCRHMPVSEPETPCDINPCTDDFCVGGVCQFESIQCDDDNECTADACVDGECVFTPIEGSCSPNACTTNGQCQNGTCVGGSPRVCANDGDPCTVASCDAILGCIQRPKSNGEPCEAAEGGDDGNQCTDDICTPHCVHRSREGSFCTFHPCQPDGLCNDQEVCVPTSRCAPPDPCPTTDGRACDDLDACSPSSSCQSGVCRPVCPPPCPTDGQACDDDNSCSSDSECTGGVCTATNCNVGAPCIGMCATRCVEDGLGCRCGGN